MNALPRTLSARAMGALLTGSALAALAVTVIAQAADITPATSSIVATFRQENVPVDAPFKRFTGHIDLNAAHPTTAHATLQVATASLDLGSAEYNAEVQKAEWLDSAVYPNATFVSTAIVTGAGGHLTAIGTFSLKGHTQTVQVPVTVTRTGNSTVFDGTLQISRKYFSIGSAEWNDVVDDTVKVRFHLVQ